MWGSNGEGRIFGFIKSRLALLFTRRKFLSWSGVMESLRFYTTWLISCSRSHVTRSFTISCPQEASGPNCWSHDVHLLSFLPPSGHLSSPRPCLLSLVVTRCMAPGSIPIMTRFFQPAWYLSGIGEAVANSLIVSLNGSHSAFEHQCASKR